ncbi:FmdB family zinc ribbon protein [Synechococcus sp. A15-127]|uniref:FmdB family zinc ribbon protein n=1 Tax=Synechococcus sp. A15-127 TaxID=1050624 RepID=UPI00164780B4|nr:FmdB family zinc ribbon protein [Synechococcus sp. A15-127]
MPVYEYSCKSGECDTYEVWRSIDQRAIQTECPTCGSEGKRVFNPPMTLSSSIRLKVEAKEPKLISKKNSIHAPEATKTRLRTNDSRPWMLNRGC